MYDFSGSVLVCTLNSEYFPRVNKGDEGVYVMCVAWSRCRWVRLGRVQAFLCEPRKSPAAAAAAVSSLPPLLPSSPLLICLTARLSLSLAYFLSVCLLYWLSSCIYIYFSPNPCVFVCLSVCLLTYCIYLSASLPVLLSVCLSVSRAVYQISYPSAPLSLHCLPGVVPFRYIYLPTYLPTYRFYLH